MRTPHQNLLESFPDLADTFHQLKVHDIHFKHILLQYEELDNEINKIDNGHAVEPSYFEEIKKKRVLAKDGVYQYLLKHKNTTTN